jgi:hypothetical protein
MHKRDPSGRTPLAPVHRAAERRQSRVAISPAVIPSASAASTIGRRRA